MCLSSKSQDENAIFTVSIYLNMIKRWVLKDQGDTEVVEHLSKVLNIDLNLANLLAQRDVTNYKEARSFFRPSLNELHDPFLMKYIQGMDTLILSPFIFS